MLTFKLKYFQYGDFIGLISDVDIAVILYLEDPVM